VFKSDIVELPAPAPARRPAPAGPVFAPMPVGSAEVEHLDLPIAGACGSRTRSVSVVLPNGYAAQPKRRYPVIYLLHGFGHNSNGGRFWFGEGYAPGLDIVALTRAAWTADDRDAAILVCPDGRTPEGGSFWEDSHSGGPIRRWLVEELIDQVDARFRTIAAPKGRLVAGHSMGAQAAMTIAISRPDRFAAVYGMSGMMTFCRSELLAYARHWFNAGMPVVGRGVGPGVDETAGAYLAFVTAFCGWPDRPGFDHPVVLGSAGTEICEPVAERFLARWPQQVAAAHPERARQLRHIGFEVGVGDEYRWGVEANRLFANSLQLLGIPFVYEEYDGRHADQLARRVLLGLLPFASRAFREGLER
jgi:S-formylglutathione hydrolase